MEPLAFTVNNEAVIAELTAFSERYETALMAGHYDQAGNMFWESALATRIGVNEELSGKDEIVAFQSRRTFSLKSRQVLKREILALGDDVGVVNIEFTLELNGQLRHGRQTQVWARTSSNPAEWRVVSAHVSHRWPASATMAYVDAASARVGLPIAPEYKLGVAAVLDAMDSVAAPLFAFKLDDELDPAGVFEP